MKLRQFIILCCTACLLLLAGCQPDTQPAQQPQTQQEAMTIQTARLSQEEQRLLSLTGSTDLLFDYIADQALQSV